MNLIQELNTENELKERSSHEIVEPSWTFLFNLLAKIK